MKNSISNTILTNNHYIYCTTSISEDMIVDNVESISDKMNGVEWRMKWKEYLKESVLNDNKNCMLSLN